MTNDKKQSIAEKIKALFSKTVENGATEDEAMAAIAKATELMEKYQMSMTELETQAEGLTQTKVSAGKYYQRMVAKYLAFQISQLTDTRVWLRGYDPIFYGFTKDTQFAEWVYNHLQNYITNAASQFSTSERLNGNTTEVGILRKNFILGAINRINTRLKAEVLLRKQTRSTATGQGLVVVDRARLVTEEYAKLNMHIRSAKRSRNKNPNESAYAAGQRAGDAASWNKPLNKGNPVLGISYKK